MSVVVFFKSGPLEISISGWATRTMGDRGVKELINAIVVLKACTPFSVKTFEFLRRTTANSPLQSVFDFLVEKTVFRHFCAGTTLQNAYDQAVRLKRRDVYSILDWAIEKDPAQVIDADSMERNKVRTIESIRKGASVNAAVAVKLSSLIPADALANAKLVLEDFPIIDQIMQNAVESKVDVYFDAEQSRIQPGIDQIALQAMKKFPGIAFNTYQMYLKDSYQRLVSDYEQITKLGLAFGCKLVRGAYMLTEDKNLLQPNIQHTHQNYDAGVLFLINALSSDSRSRCIIATHNRASLQFASKLITERSLQAQVYFGQLMGMSDFQSQQLAASGMRVYKYLPFGPVHEVMPYLSRRILENSPQFFSTIKSVTNEDIRYFLKLLKEKLLHRKIES